MSVEILKKLAEQLADLEAKGLTDSDEYEKLSDDYQTIALNEIEGNIFDDE